MIGQNLFVLGMIIVFLAYVMKLTALLSFIVNASLLFAVIFVVSIFVDNDKAVPKTES